MGYYIVTGTCIGCGKLLSFNPHKVPSISIKNGQPHPDGDKQPICKECVDRANPIRKQLGLPEIIYDNDAYKTCLEEGEL